MKKRNKKKSFFWLKRRKNQKKIDVQLEESVWKWICQLTGSRITSGSNCLGEVLKGGVILCELMNKLRPNSIKKIHKSKNTLFNDISGY